MLYDIEFIDRHHGSVMCYLKLKETKHLNCTLITLLTESTISSNLRKYFGLFFLFDCQINLYIN